MQVVCCSPTSGIVKETDKPQRLARAKKRTKYLELPGVKDHFHGKTRGKDAMASAYYSKAMLKRICQAFGEETPTMGLKRRFGGATIRVEGPDPGGVNSEPTYMDEETLPLDEGQVL